MKKTLLLPICILILGSINAQVKCNYKCGQKEQVSIVNSPDIKFSETPVSTVVYGPKSVIQEQDQVKHTYMKGTNCRVQLVTKLPKVQPVNDVKDLNPTNLIPGYTERFSANDVPVTILVNPAEKNGKPCIQTCCNCPCYDSDGNVVVNKRTDLAVFNFQPQDITKETENERPSADIIDKQVITKTMAVQQSVDVTEIDGRVLIDPYPINEDGNVLVDERTNYNPVNDQSIAGLTVVNVVDNVNVVTGELYEVTVKGESMEFHLGVLETHNPRTINKGIRSGGVIHQPEVRCKCKKKVAEETKIEETTEEPIEEQKILPVINEPIIVDELINVVETTIVDEEAEIVEDVAETEVIDHSEIAIVVDEPAKPCKCKLTGDIEPIVISAIQTKREVVEELVEVIDEPDASTEELIEPFVLPVTTKGDMTVYPNPAIHLVNVKWEGDGKMNMVHVFDMTGKLVRSERTYNNKVQFEKNELPKGMYLIRAINQKGEVLKVDRFSFQ